MESQEAALIKLLEQPKSPSNDWLVYADWLQEAGREDEARAVRTITQRKYRPKFTGGSWTILGRLQGKAKGIPLDIFAFVRLSEHRLRRTSSLNAEYECRTFAAALDAMITGLKWAWRFGLLDPPDVAKMWDPEQMRSVWTTRTARIRPKPPDALELLWSTIDRDYDSHADQVVMRLLGTWMMPIDAHMADVTLRLGPKVAECTARLESGKWRVTEHPPDARFFDVQFLEGVYPDMLPGDRLPIRIPNYDFSRTYSSRSEAIQGALQVLADTRIQGNPI